MTRARKFLWAGLSGLFGIILLGGGQFWLGVRYYRGLPLPVRAPLGPVSNLASSSATTCGTCHQQIASEWRGTAHEQASQSAMYKSEFVHEGRFYLCTYCHTPLVEQRSSIVKGLLLIWPRTIPWQRSNPHYQPALAVEGVTCVACHQRGDRLAGPHQITNAPHPTETDENFGSVALCAPCHRLDIGFGSSLLRPAQDTIAEWQTYRRAGGDKQCVDCHMPEVEARPLLPGGRLRKSRSHRLLGPGDVNFLRSGIVVQNAVVKPHGEGAEAQITIFNGSGHRLPTAEPRRRVAVVLEALGPQAKVLASAVQSLERRMDPVRLTEPPDGDSTLLPRETRRMTLNLLGPLPQTTQQLRVAVRFYLWHPNDPIAQDAGQDEQSLTRIVYQASFAWPLSR